MRLVIVRHRETDWTLAGRLTGTTEVGLTTNDRAQAASLPPLLERVLHGERAVLVSSPRKRATETTALALSSQHLRAEPLVAEFDYGNYEGLTEEEGQQRSPGWDIWRDGCPRGESTAEVGSRADQFLRTNAEIGSQAVLVVTHGHFSRIMAARTLGLAPEDGRLFASATGGGLAHRRQPRRTVHRLVEPRHSPRDRTRVGMRARRMPRRRLRFWSHRTR